MKLRVGDVLVKKRGGGGKKVRVLHIQRNNHGERVACLDSEAKGNSKSANARQWWVPLGEDGLPDGYKREVKP